MAVQRDLMSRTLAAVMAVVVVVGLPSHGCSFPGGDGLEYRVGDSSEWTLPPRPDYYTNWSSSHFFKIGDSLVFNFEKWRYNVVQVTKQEYERCTAYNPLKVFNSDPVIIPLREKGVFYFICNISRYCSLGMNISITVHNCPCIEPPSSPSPSPSPSQFPSPSPPPPASPAPVPPPSSPPSRSAQPPSPGTPGGASQPPVQVTSPAPSPVKGSQEAPSKSAALVHKEMLDVGSYGLYFGLCLVVLVVFG